MPSEPHKLNTLLKIIEMMINLLDSGFTSDLKNHMRFLWKVQVWAETFQGFGLQWLVLGLENMAFN